MPGSVIAELILHPILEFIFHVLGYYIGRVVVFVFTLGRIKCDPILTDTPRHRTRWAGTFHRCGQRIYLTSEATAGIGVFFVLLVVGGGFLIHYLRT